MWWRRSTNWLQWEHQQQPQHRQWIRYIRRLLWSRTTTRAAHPPPPTAVSSSRLPGDQRRRQCTSYSGPEHTCGLRKSLGRNLRMGSNEQPRRNGWTCAPANGHLTSDDGLPDLGYTAAVAQLNRLQSNAVTLASHQGTERQRFLDTWKYLERSGLTVEQLDELPVIHVAGTKGKGSVCSFVESILREHGLKTGFFSSPHLVSVTERIRLNGQPISECDFARHFWELFGRLDAAKKAPGDLPPYFKFLTLLAFHVFRAENVDVAVVEVGIGGLYDCTNVVRNTRTVGITSLGLDHVTVLGDTIEKIAAQKAGIIKPGSHVFTVPQPGAGNRVIAEKAQEQGAALTIVPDFDEYLWQDGGGPDPRLASTSVFRTNISLAVQLAMDWLMHCGLLAPDHDRRVCTAKITAGIAKFHWPGRYQVIERGPTHFYLDGAHTQESIVACLEWFQLASSRRRVKKCLLFFLTGTRDVRSLAQPLIASGLFDLIVVCPNVVDTQETVMDNVVANVNSHELTRTCQAIQKTLQELVAATAGVETPVEVADSVTGALKVVNGFTGDAEKDVLVTGSLYLVGTSLIVLNRMSTVDS